MLFKEHLSEDDRPNVEALLTHSFPTEFEADLVRRLGRAHKLTAEHTLWQHGALVGYLAYSRVIVEGADTERTFWGLGPMAIDSEYQGQGLALKLLKESFEETHADALFVLGHPGLYDKVGFRPAADFGLSFSDNPATEAAFMAMECWQGALSGLKGRVVYDRAFYEE
ncbi:MAG: N-acetyltransferase [Alphaproteobacteria bacterium]|nr:MAG: N-acetyltransferase [Alphaproteobacteria bacterium]